MGIILILLVPVAPVQPWYGLIQPPFSTSCTQAAFEPIRAVGVSCFDQWLQQEQADAGGLMLVQA